MSAITIRNLPDTAHDALRIQAAQRGASLESMLRDLLVRAAGEGGSSVVGMSEASPAFLVPAAEPPGFAALHGALQGTVHVPEGTDLAAPTGEPWQADAR